MSESRQIDWSKTTFEGSRREQLRRWQTLTVRERLEALDSLTELAERFKKRNADTNVCESTSDQPYSKP